MVKDSAPEKWIYREHTRVKHQILAKYLKGWVPILGKFHKRLVYFDGFAGRGEYEGGKPGSPVIAMGIANELIEQKRTNEVVCVFIEKDAENFANLVQVVDKCKTAYPRVAVGGPYQDEFAAVVSSILDKFEKTLAPSFFFIDPFGFGGVPFHLVKRILAIQRTEVFFTYMHRDIARFLAAPNVEEVFDELFGTQAWRQIVQEDLREGDREHALRELYVRQLRDEAHARYTWSFRVCADDRIQTLYYLIHAANHFKALQLMKDIMYSQGAGGLFAYLGPQDFVAHAQLPLFPDDLDSLRAFLLSRFRGRAVSYNTVLEETYMETPHIDKHYRQALKTLEAEGQIGVTRVTSKTARGLSGYDRITFPQASTS